VAREGWRGVRNLQRCVNVKSGVFRPGAPPLPHCQPRPCGSRL